MIYVACRLDWKMENLRILLIEKKKLTVKAPGTETITTFLPFHSLVENGTADRMIVSNLIKGFKRRKKISYEDHMCSS